MLPSNVCSFNIYLVRNILVNDINLDKILLDSMWCHLHVTGSHRHKHRRRRGTTKEVETMQLTLDCEK